jgi:hypothetical protein
MKHKTKSKTLEKPKRNTRKTIKKKSKSPDRPVSMETIKKREQRGLVRTIQKYENNLTNLIKNSYYENPLLVSKLLMVALFPQITNSTNIHHYQEYFMLLQTDNNFKDMVDVNEAPETDLDNKLFHYNLYPLLHQRLLEITRECVVGGYTKKVSNQLRNIATEVSPTGD